MFVPSLMDFSYIKTQNYCVEDYRMLVSDSPQIDPLCVKEIRILLEENQREGKIFESGKNTLILQRLRCGF